MIRRLLDLQHPFFRPLWRRVVITAICLLWGLFEFAQGAPVWGVLFLGLGAICAWEFFVAFDPRTPDEKEGDER